MLHLTGKIFCPGCVRPGRLEDYLSVASAAGFTGLSLWSSVHAEARERGLSPAAIAELLDRHRIGVEVLEAVIDWANNTDAGAVRANTEQLCKTAVELGAGVLCAAAMEPTLDDFERAASNFALVCDVAGDYGIRVALESLAFGAVDHFRIGRDLVERANRDNGGFLVDSWHWFRTGADLALLRSLPGERIFNIQINDAPAVPTADTLTETLHQRLLPGAGAMDYEVFFGALATMNVRCAIGPEVFSDALKDRDRQEATQALKDSLDALLARPAIAALCNVSG